MPQLSARDRPVARVVGLAAFALAVAGCVVVVRLPSAAPHRTATLAAAAGAATAARPPWLRAVPPALLLPGGAEVDAAIAPWQGGNYADAALRLDALAMAHPAFTTLDFYRGAAWLLAGVPSAAIPALERARGRGGAETAGRAAWYLGIAYLDVCRPGAAARAFGVACRHQFPEACRAGDWVQRRTTALVQPGGRRTPPSPGWR